MRKKGGVSGKTEKRGRRERKEKKSRDKKPNAEACFKSGR